MVKNLPANEGEAGDALQAPAREDPLGEELATHSSVLAWKNPIDRGTWWATVHGLQRVGHD